MDQKVITSCHQCGRQYKASVSKIGAKYKCHCGAANTVSGPKKGLEAWVVRCSSCGGARLEDEDNCQFCGSSFTLHEKDLKTVCPECFYRISSHAKYCHFCGHFLKPETSVDKISDMACPSCGDSHKLAAREVGSDFIPFYECDSCAGMWLHSGTFKFLIKQSRTQSVSLTGLFPVSYNLDQDIKKPSDSFYRKCPLCSETMNRKNFVEKSGVVIDFCKPHGFWFDHNELAKILKWVEEGGFIKAEEMKLQEIKTETILKSKSPPSVWMTEISGPGYKGSGYNLLDFFSDISDF